MTEETYLKDSLLQLQKLKTQVDRAIAQMKDEHLFSRLGPESNSIAIIMKHLAGNMRSRWADFLTSDGEKPNRDRDAEFESHAEDTRERILTSWEDGWDTVFVTIKGLKPDDLARTITIRGERHSVLEAINRQMTHYAAHVGQIVLLAKQAPFRDKVMTLSCPCFRFRWGAGWSHRVGRARSQDGKNLSINGGIDKYFFHRAKLPQAVYIRQPLRTHLHNSVSQ